MSKRPVEGSKASSSDRDERPTKMKFRAPAARATFDLTGKVFVVSGASKGLGAAVARHCKAQGCSGLLLIDRDEGGQSISSELSDSGCVAKFITADLSKGDDCKQVAKHLEALERIDGLVNCAGVTTRGSLADTSLETWDMVMNTNLRSAFLLTQSVTELMKKHEFAGSIVNISSVHGHGGGMNMLPYSVSKAGVICMTKNNAVELQDFGIRVNVVNVGWTATETEDTFQKKSNSDWIEDAEKTFPFGRLLRSEDVAYTVGFLLSDASVTMTGTEVNLHPESVVGCLPRQFGNT